MKLKEGGDDSNNDYYYSTITYFLLLSSSSRHYHLLGSCPFSSLQGNCAPVVHNRQLNHKLK